MPKQRATIAVPTGDPSGIGPEICLKAALDPAVRAACDIVLVSDPNVIARHAKACGIEVELHAIGLHAIDRATGANWSNDRLNVLACPQPEAATLELGAVSAASGRASIAFCAAAIKAALAGEVDAEIGRAHV